jgi:MarR family 2-MHQ and catechol resistance regulon transcriptional repressor
MTARTQHEQDLGATHLWLLLWKASRSVEKHAHRAVARFGMVASDFGVLEALLHKGSLTVKQLGEKVLLTSGSMTAAVDRLAARGLVQRSADQTDRRIRFVQLTDAGRELIERAFAEHQLALESALEGFIPQDRAALLPLLRQLGKAAETNY